MMKAVFYYFERDLVKWLRGRVTVISSLVMPAAWLVFVGLALPTKFTDNYLAVYHTWYSCHDDAFFLPAGRDLL